MEYKKIIIDGKEKEIPYNIADEEVEKNEKIELNDEMDNTMDFSNVLNNIMEKNNE